MQCARRVRVRAHVLPPMSRRLPLVFFAAVALLTAVTTAPARVFMRLGPAERIIESLREAGGTAVYESDVTINGGHGRLTVTGFAQSAHDVARILSRAAGVNTSALTAGGVLNATLEDGGGVVRLLAFHLAPQGRTLVVTIAQSASDYRQSQAHPARAPTGAVPPYPDSAPRLAVSDEKIGISLSVSDTTAAPETVHAAMAAQLKRDGWTPALPDSPAERPLRIYRRRAELCCVHVAPAPGTGGNVITLLHKQQGIE